MKRYYLQLLIICFLVQPLVHGQTRTANQTYKPPPKTLSDRSDSLKMAFADVKTSLNSWFKSRRDTISILIQNIEYDDANLVTLKEYLKKSKGVKSVLMQYKSATAIMEVMFKGKSTDLWDELPHESKDPFKLLEANDNSLTLQYKGH
jgi:hypothetical protein